MMDGTPCDQGCLVGELLNKRLEALEEEHIIMKTSDKAQTEMLNQIKSDTDQLIDIFKSVQLGIRFSVSFINFVKWCAGVGATIAALLGFIYYLKTGHFPQE